MDTISVVLQVIACLATVSAMWMMGNKHISGPALGVVSDIAFFALNVYLHLWVVAFLCGTLALIHTRNFFKWRREA